MLLHEVYPGLRRTDYTIDYTVLPFTVEEGKQVISTHPQYLSLNEFYQIALSYPVDSPEYEAVFVTALRYFPDDPVANNNMAAIALRKNDLKEAHKYLDKLTDFAGAHNNMGVLKALEGDFRAAEAHFPKAIEHGSSEAKFNNDNLTSLLKRKGTKPATGSACRDRADDSPHRPSPRSPEQRTWKEGTAPSGRSLPVLSMYDPLYVALWLSLFTCRPGRSGPSRSEVPASRPAAGRRSGVSGPGAER